MRKGCRTVVGDDEKSSIEERFWKVAEERFGGHATIFQFTSNCVAFFGTPSDDVREFLNFTSRYRFKTRDEAMAYAVKHPDFMCAWTIGMKVLDHG